MPRNFELTWQPGAGDRPGRWRKKYKKRILYLGTGSSKSDLESYRQALAKWKVEKQKIDQELGQVPKPHQPEYEEAIADWEKLLRWSLTHNDTDTGQRARDRLADLRSRLESKAPPPLEWGDRFWDRFTLPPEVLERVDAIMKKIDPPKRSSTGERGGKWIQPKGHLVFTQSEKGRVIWQDRLERDSPASEDRSRRISEHFQRYRQMEQARVAAGNLSHGRFTSKRNNLERFLDWIGRETSLDAITGAMIQNFHAELINQIATDRLAPDTAHNRLGDTISFIRWLWRTEVIDELPRILAQKNQALAITKKLSSPKVFTIPEVKKCLEEANDRTKLYLLLMLNCGMYQGDVSDLKQEEVDWQAGTVTRKRSKTKSHAAVPVVRYQLWPETFRLLEQFRQPTGGIVLLNTNGNPLVFRGLKQNGDPLCNDSIKNAYDRLRTKTGIKKPMKLLRKTSASLIRSNASFRGLEDLFLGLSPATISDRHYAQPPEQLLAEAIDWLGKQYGVVAEPASA